jgi:nitroreductase / dihydropteridine reductase
MNIAELAVSRRTAKAFDPNKKIPESIMKELRVLLRHSPSSINSQPWHFIIASSGEGKARTAQAAQGPYAYNRPKILNASHVVVLCARTDMDEFHLAAILAQEKKDGRFPAVEDMEKQRKSRAAYVNLHRFDREDVQHWMEKQVYLALGALLLGAAALQIAACPMEGFDPKTLDEKLGLRSRNLTAVVLVALGYAGLDDWNVKLPKSRLPAESLFTDL